MIFGVPEETVRAWAKDAAAIAPGIVCAEVEETQALCDALGEAVFSVTGESLPEVVLACLREQNATLACAESCTGGLVTASLVEVPGASDVLMEGVVTYANESKMARLGVPAEMLETHGAVSAETAAAMAEGVRRALGTTYGTSTTGVAGPGGGTPEKPVGTVYIGVSGPKGTVVERLNVKGDRMTVRLYSTMAVLHRLLKATKA